MKNLENLGKPRVYPNLFPQPYRAIPGRYKTRPGPEFSLLFWPGPVRPGPVSDFFGPARFDPDRFGPLAITAQYCPVLHSTVQYCTVLFIGYDKKIKNAPRSASWAKRVFDFFSRIFTRCIKKSKKQNSKKLEFQTIFEKVTLEPL